VPDPLWINASAGAPSYDAAELRRLFALLTQYNGRTLGGRAGVRPGGNALQTSIVSTTITVRAGLALIDPALTTAQGPYWVCLPADELHTLTAAHATLPRKDITVLRVYDTDEDSSGLRLARSEYIVGTAAGSPTEPAVPAGSIKLSTIDVPQSGGGSASVTHTYPWTVASGGILPVRNSTDRGTVTPHVGGAIYRVDRYATGAWVEIHDGTFWRVQGPAICTNAADLASAVTSPINGQLATLTSTNVLAQYKSGAWHLAAPVSFPRPTQTGSGSLSANSSATIATVNIPDLGVPYKVEVSAKLATTTPAVAVACRLQGTVNSAVWDTNRIEDSDYGPGYVIGQDTVISLAVRTSTQQSGATTVRLLAQAGTSGITIGTSGYAFSVRAVPAVP
jgi:hypothetical protein